MNEIPCPFEKVITSNRCDCENSTRFAIAERIGAACRSHIAQKNCATLLALLRERSRFVLKHTGSPEQIPFGKELQIMLGGLAGLQQLLSSGKPAPSRVENIHALILKARDEYGSLSDLPFQHLVRSIAGYKTKRRATDDLPRKK